MFKHYTNVKQFSLSKCGTQIGDWFSIRVSPEMTLKQNINVQQSYVEVTNNEHMQNQAPDVLEIFWRKSLLGICGSVRVEDIFFNNLHLM